MRSQSDRIAACIFVIVRGSREDGSEHDRIAARTAGYSEIPLQLFFISRLFMVRFSYGFQQNDGNTLLSTVLVLDEAQIYFLFSSW